MPPSFCTIQRLLLPRYLVYVCIGVACTGINPVSGQTGPTPLSILAPPQQGTASTSQEPHVTLDVENMPIQEVLYKIVKQAELALSWSDAKVPLKGNITLQVKDIPVSKVLALVLKDQSAEARMSLAGRTVLIVRKEPKLRTEDQRSVGTITGRVTDSTSGEGIAGVTATVHGTKLSVVTNSRGDFSLAQVPLGTHVVTFKLLGYTSASRTVQVEEKRTTILRVILKQTANMLSGVVTTATGVQRKLEIGNSIASINVDSVMRVAPVATLTDLLETRVPGLTVQRASGTPGDPSRIRIRGSSSIERNNEPIVIVDGIRVYGDQSAGLSENLSQRTNVSNGINNSLVRTLTPSPIDQIDVNSIETIDVFKGPSAAAMYGSDAANGVIVITTKRGKVQPARWTLTINQGLQTLPGKYPVGTYRFGHRESGNILDGTGSVVCARTDFACITDSVKRFQALNDPRLSVIGRGHDQNLSITTGGGVPALQYSITGSFGKQIGMLRMPDAEAAQFVKTFGKAPSSWLRRPERYETWGGTGKLSAQPSTRTSITLESVVYSSTQQRSSFSNAVKLLSSMYVDVSRVGESLLLPNLYRRMTSDAFRTQHTGQLQWTTIPWLPIDATVGLNSNVRTDETLVPRGLNRLAFEKDGRYAIGRGLDKTKSFNLSTRVPIPLVRITMATGFTGASQSISVMNAQADTIAAGTLLPANFTMATQSTRAGTTYGWYAEPRLNVTSRFFVMPGLRLDNNGLAGSRAGVMGLPKMNFSWIASDESFFPWKRAIDLLRLRMAFGASGVQPGLTDRERTYLVAGGTVGGDAASSLSTPIVGSRSLSLSGTGNTQLRPERSVEIEGGFDTDVWNNRIHLDITGYRKVKRDAILSIPLAYSVGGGNTKINIGEVRNTGVEVMTSLQVLQRKNVSWNAGVSLNRDDNVVVRLNPGQDRIVSEGGAGTGGGETRVVPGYPLFGRWVKPILGYADVNGNGVLEKTEVRVGDSMVYLGRQEPDYTMSINSSVVLYGRVIINAGVDYTHGVTQLNNVMNNALSPFGADPNASFAQQAAYAGAAAGTSYGFIQTVSILRFNTLSMGWTVPASLAALVRSRSVVLSLQGKNLGLKSNYRGKDPLVGASPTRNSVIDDGALPLPRSVSLRVQIGN